MIDETTPGTAAYVRSSLSPLIDLFLASTTINSCAVSSPAAVKLLVERLKKDYPLKKLSIVLGMMADKDIASTLKEFGQIAKHWYFVSLSNIARSAKPELLQERFVGLGYNAGELRLCESVVSALNLVLEYLP